MRNHTFLVKKNRLGKLASFAVVVISVIGTVGAAWAQEAPPPQDTAAHSPPPMNTSFDLQLFKPAPGPLNFFNIESPEIGDDMKPSVGVMLFYGRRPLAFLNCDQEDECSDELVAEDGSGQNHNTIHAVDHLFTMDILASFNFAKYLQAGLSLPLTVVQHGDYANDVRDDEGQDSIYWLEPGPTYTTVFAPRDIRVYFKGRFLGKDRENGIHLAASANINIPIWELIGYGRKEPGDDGYKSQNGVYGYGGDDTVSGTVPRLMFGFRHNSIRTAVNLGFNIRKKVKMLSIETGNQLDYGAAFGYSVIPEVELVAELYGNKSFVGEFTDTEGMSLLFLAGGRFPIKNFTAYAAAGGGISAGIGVPQYQFVAGGAWTPVVKEEVKPDDLLINKTDRDTDGIENELDKCPDEPEDIDDFEDEDGCPDYDNDKDGVPDGYDSCVMDAEDKDGFKDDDGCPDLDHDEDTIKEPTDKCPDVPEDFDEFEDDDGCPEEDNDKDGILDPDDFCPIEAEDKDNFEDEDGCPEPDNDKDGVPDALDKCPDEPETLNGSKDEDGCPDKGNALVVVTENQIELKEMIKFKKNSDEIRGVQSFDILNIVKGILKANPDMRLSIEGHTDNKGSADHNRELSTKRANSVKKYLVRNGIEAERLETAGFGPDKPIASNKTKAGRAENRRVEFIILQQEETTISVDADADGGESKSGEGEGGGMDFTSDGKKDSGDSQTMDLTK